MTVPCMPAFVVNAVISSANFSRCTIAQLLRSVATTLGGDAVTDAVAETALDVANVIVADLHEATNSGQSSDIVAAMVDVYSGVSQSIVSRVGSDNSKQKPLTLKTMGKLKRKLKSSADKICEALTQNGAPDAPPVGSASSDFSFSCQKVKQRSQRSGSTKENNQASSVCTLGFLTTYTINFCGYRFHFCLLDCRMKWLS